MANDVRITQSARNAFTGMLRALEVPWGWCMRLKLRGRDLLLGLDSPRVEDYRYDHNGRVVLVLDAATAASCFGKTLDYDKKSGFVLQDGSESNCLTECHRQP